MIFNYTKSTQFERNWNEITLQCRGLVLNSQGEIIARPFKKFFNWEEHQSQEIPYHLDFEIFEKMDGSLGIGFWYKDQFHLASRGSFDSDFAKRATQILQKYSWQNLPKENTYLFEMIYPENRIVVDYKGRESLVLLGVIETETGKEIPHNQMLNEYSSWEIVPRYEGIKDFNKLKALNLNNSEGFIIRFSNGFRMKIKFAEYIRLHSILTECSTKVIWRHLREGRDFKELLDGVPDEFFNWVKNKKEVLLNDYETIEAIIHSDHIQVCRALGDCSGKSFEIGSPRRKEFAAENFKSSRYPGLVFAVQDGLDYSDEIWKMIEPKFEKPFLQD